MKITLPPDAAQTVKKLAPWTGGRYELPELGYVLLRANGQVTATVTNLATTIEVVIPATVEEEGAVLLPARILQNALVAVVKMEKRAV